MNEEPYTSELEQMGTRCYTDRNTRSRSGTGCGIMAMTCGAYLNRPHIASKYIDYILDNTDIKVIYYGHDLALAAGEP